ncbi:MAG: hypothetical protein SGJ18_06015 [Pseudomonadota bacterium]|nr:hypothetical protein [Pseudomonadota bacterium]
MQSKISFLMTAAMMVWLAGCEPTEYDSISRDPSCQNCSGNNDQNGGITDPPADPWQKVEKDMTGYLKMGDKQVKLIGVDKVNKTLTLRVPITGADFPEIIVEIPQLAGARVLTGNDVDGKGFINLEIPLELLLKYVDIGNPKRLPNGDPLPAVPGGELPGVAVNFPVENVRIHIYLGVEVLGIYVEVPFDPHVKLTLPLKTQKADGTQERTVGYLSSVPKKNQFAGGFFLSLVIPEAIARQLDELL